MKDANTTSDLTKISLSLYPALLERFKKHMGQVIKRDAFLNQLISREVPILRAELEGMRNSEAARRHIGRKLREMKPVTINVVVEKSVAAELNQVVDEANLSRDSFLNYLLYCLDPTPAFYRYFDLPQHFTYSKFTFALDPPALSPMKTITETLWDPFYYLRAAVSEQHGVGLYALEMPPSWHGIACHLPQESVPKTRANKKMLLEGERLLKELEAFDAAAFSSNQATEKS